MLFNSIWIALAAVIISNIASTRTTLENVPLQTCEDAKLSHDFATHERVKVEFLHAWDAYKAYAWGHDELKPLGRTFRDWHAKPLLITAVEALDTLIIMGLKEEADRTREYITTNLLFDHDMEVGVFEVNIRVLGGLLSAYQLSLDKRLLELAEDLGNRLLPAFNSPTKMPFTHVNLKTGAARGNVSNPAEIGTYILEFGALSRLTHNPIYFEKAKTALVELYQRRSSTDLVGSKIDVTTGEWLDAKSHIGGGIDSYYEYLYKCSVLFNDKDCKRMWNESKDAIHFYLREERKGRTWYGRADMNTGVIVDKYFTSLDAFFAGLVALDGDVELGQKLQNTYYEMWEKIGALPESIHYGEMAIMWDPFFLRPEIIESAFYLQRLTKDDRYTQMGNRFFCDIVKRCRSEHGYSALSSIIKGNLDDQLESFFFSETMKYLYLLLAPENTVDLSDVVFTTEGHLMRKSLLSRDQPLSPQS